MKRRCSTPIYPSKDRKWNKMAKDICKDTTSEAIVRLSEKQTNKKNTTNQTKHTAALWMPVTDITKLGMSNTNMQCQSGKMANYLGEKFRSSEDKRGEGPLVFFRKFFILSITNAYAFS